MGIVSTTMIASLLLAATFVIGPERSLTPATLRPVGVSARLVANGELGLATWDGGVGRIASDGQVLDETGIRFGSPPWAVADGDGFLIFTYEGSEIVVRELDRDGVPRGRAWRYQPAIGYGQIVGIARTAESFCLIFSNGRLLILDAAFEVRALLHFEPEVPVAVASNGTGFVILFADGDSMISSVAISASGTAGAINRYVDENARIDTASLVSDGTSYFAVWATVHELHAMSLDADAQAKSPILRLADDVWYGYIPRNERPVDATWDGRGIAVTWVAGDTRRLVIGRFARDGQVMTPPREVKTFGLPAANPSVAFARDHLLLSWTEANGGVTRVARIESESLETTTSHVLLHALPGQGGPRAATGIATYGVAWTEFATHLRFARFTRDGVSLDGAGILLGGTVNGYAIAYLDDSYLVIWSNGQRLFGAAIHEGGVAPAEPRRFELPMDGIFPELAVNEGHAVLVWQRPGAHVLEHTPMYAAEIHEDGTVGEPHAIEESSSLSHTDAKIVATPEGFLLAYSLSYCSWKSCGLDMTQRFISLDMNGAPVSAPMSSPERLTFAMVRGADRVLTVHSYNSIYSAVLRSEEGSALSPPIDLGSLPGFCPCPASAAWVRDRFVIATLNDALTLTSVDASGTVITSARITEKDVQWWTIVSSGSEALLVYGRGVANVSRLALRTIGIARQRPIR